MSGAVTIHLSRKNLQTLLNKLDRNKHGGSSRCCIIKYDHDHPNYPMGGCEMATIIAVEDDAYYAHREAGPVTPEDDHNKTIASTSIVNYQGWGRHTLKVFYLTKYTDGTHRYHQDFKRFETPQDIEDFEIQVNQSRRQDPW